MRITGGGLLAGIVLLAGSVGQEARASAKNTVTLENNKVMWEQSTFSHKTSKAREVQNLNFKPAQSNSFFKQSILEPEIKVEESWRGEQKTFVTEEGKYEEGAFVAKSIELQKESSAAESSKLEEEKFASSRYSMKRTK
jgi:hypothetical protein